MKNLYRIKSQGKLGGVCAGLGEYLNLDPSLIRIIFILLIFTGSGIFIYLLLWLILPNSDNVVTQNQETTISQNAEEISDTAKAVGESIKTNHPDLSNSKWWLGGLLILFGILFFLKNLGINYFWWLHHRTIWPIALIVLGIYLLSQNRQKKS